AYGDAALEFEFRGYGYSLGGSHYGDESGWIQDLGQSKYSRDGNEIGGASDCSAAAPTRPPLPWMPPGQLARAMRTTVAQRSHLWTVSNPGSDLKLHSAEDGGVRESRAVSGRRFRVFPASEAT